MVSLSPGYEYFNNLDLNHWQYDKRRSGTIYQETNTEPSARSDPPPPPGSVKLFSWNIKNNLICSLTACCHYCWEKLPVIIKKTGAR